MDVRQIEKSMWIYFFLDCYWNGNRIIDRKPFHSGAYYNYIIAAGV